MKTVAVTSRVSAARIDPAASFVNEVPITSVRDPTVTTPLFVWIDPDSPRVRGRCTPRSPRLSSAAKSAPHLPASHEVFERAVDDLAEELSEMGCQYW